MQGPRARLAGAETSCCSRAGGGLGDVVKGLRQNHQLHLPSGRLGKAGRGQSGLRTKLSVLPQLVARVLFHPTSSSFPFTSTPFPPTLLFIWRSPPPFPSFPSSHPLDLIVPFCCLQARSLKGVRHLMSLIPILCRWDGVRDTHTHTRIGRTAESSAQPPPA